jgi:hypothetical protein
MQWAMIVPHCLGGECDPGRTFYRRFRALAEDADFEYAMIKGSIVKVHRHGRGVKGALKARPSDALAAV